MLRTEQAIRRGPLTVCVNLEEYRPYRNSRVSSRLKKYNIRIDMKCMVSMELLNNIKKTPEATRKPRQVIVKPFCIEPKHLQYNRLTIKPTVVKVFDLFDVCRVCRQNVLREVSIAEFRSGR